MTTITLCHPDGDKEYPGVSDWQSDGKEIDFKLGDGTRIISNFPYVVEERAEE